MADVWKGLPKRIKIIGKWYKTKIVDKVDEEDSSGESDMTEQLITLLREQGFEQARDTTLHESLHGVEHQLDLELEEKQVHLMATGVLALLRENPALVKFLMAKEPKDLTEEGKK